MTDIFQEVEDELRRDRFKKAWSRYGIYVIAVAVLIVVATAGYRGYVAWDTARKEAAAERFLAALERSQQSDPAAAVAALEAMTADAPSGYRTLAAFRLASELAASGDTGGAIEAFRDLARDRDLDGALRGLARVRAAYLLLDSGDPDAAAGEVDGLASEEGGPWTYPAKEVMGLAAYDEGELKRARTWFEDIEEDAVAPPDIRRRAQLMLALLRGQLADPSAEPAGASDTAPAASNGGAATDTTNSGQGEGEVGQ